MTVKRSWIICGPLIYLLFSTFNESIMPCEIKVLIELYGPIDTGVIIWITNIIGKIDCISFYLPSFDPRFDRHRAFLTFSKRYSNWRYIYVFYFCSYIWSRAQFFFLFFSSFFFFFFGNRSTTQNRPFPFLNTKWFKIGKKFVVEVVEITTETNVSELFFIFIVFYLYPRIPPFCAEIVANTKTRP